MGSGSCMPDFAAGAGLVHEWIVRRDEIGRLGGGPGDVNAEDAAEEYPLVLGMAERVATGYTAGAAVAQCDVEIAVSAEGQGSCFRVG